MLNAANRPAINQGDVFMNQNLFTTNGTGRRQGDFNDRAILNGAMVDRNSAANRVSPISISVS
jgi:hypothetical protein